MPGSSPFGEVCAAKEVQRSWGAGELGAGRLVFLFKSGLS